jgi:hypothetical protein
MPATAIGRAPSPGTVGIASQFHAGSLGRENPVLIVQPLPCDGAGEGPPAIGAKGVLMRRHVCIHRDVVMPVMGRIGCRRRLPAMAARLSTRLGRSSLFNPALAILSKPCRRYSMSGLPWACLG